MPAVAVVAAVGLGELGITAGGIGAALLGAEAASATIIGATTVGEVVGGAIIGAGTSALSAAIQGGDIGQGMLVGALTGGIGPVISGAVGEAIGPTLGGSEAAARAVTSGISKGVTGALGSALTGGDPLRGGLIGLVSGAATGATSDLLGKTGSQALGGALSYGLGQAFAPDAATKQAVSSTVGPSTYSPTVKGQTSQQVSSTAPIGGALLASPTLGYTPGSAFLGGSDKEKPAQNVWNVASLKEGAPVGPSTSDASSQG